MVFVAIIFMIIVVTAVAGIVSVIVALLVNAFGVPLIYRLRGTPREKRRIGWGWRVLLFLLVGAITFSVCIVGFVGWAFVQTHEYWHNPGWGDVYRMPLEYPYEITMIDTPGRVGWIRVWVHAKGFPHSVATPESVEAYYKRGDLIVGRTNSTSNLVLPWFTFDLATGAFNEYPDHASYVQALTALGFASEPTLLTTQQQWDDYWNNVAPTKPWRIELW